MVKRPGSQTQKCTPNGVHVEGRNSGGGRDTMWPVEDRRGNRVQWASLELLRAPVWVGFHVEDMHTRGRCDTNRGGELTRAGRSASLSALERT